jgi:hypothetical protein
VFLDHDTGHEGSSLVPQDDHDPLRERAPTHPHVSAHHRDTIRQIMRHPVSHDIDWRAVVALVEAVGHVERTHKGRLLVTLGDETETFEAPRHKDIDTQQVVDLRRMLRDAGFGDALEPDSPRSMSVERTVLR